MQEMSLSPPMIKDLSSGMSPKQISWRLFLTWAFSLNRSGRPWRLKYNIVDTKDDNIAVYYYHEMLCSGWNCVNCFHMADCTVCSLYSLTESMSTECDGISGQKGYFRYTNAMVAHNMKPIIDWNTFSQCAAASRSSHLGYFQPPF